MVANMRQSDLNLHATLKQIRYFWLQGLNTMEIANKLRTSEGLVYNLLDFTKELKNSGKPG